MKILVIGLGSMGKRRIRLLRRQKPDADITGIDVSEERTTAAAEEFGISVSHSIEDAAAEEQLCCAFVCTPPFLHASLIRLLISREIPVFTELNLTSDGYEEFIKNDSARLFLSSTFLYRKDIQWLTKRVCGQRVNYLYHTGQYLADWHPWEDYRHFFVADKKTNGCREILAVELPWMTECFGRIKGLHVLKDKMSGLLIDYPDNYMILFEHENGSKGMMAVEVVSRKAVRRLEIFNEELQLYWDGTPDSLGEWDVEDRVIREITTYNSVEQDTSYCENIIENAYMDEITAFFAMMEGDDSKVRYDFKKDLEVIELIDTIEGSL